MMGLGSARAVHSSRRARASSGSYCDVRLARLAPRPRYRLHRAAVLLDPGDCLVQGDDVREPGAAAGVRVAHARAGPGEVHQLGGARVSLPVVGDVGRLFGEGALFADEG